MKLRHIAFFAALLIVLILIDPLAWVVYWAQVAVYSAQHGNPY
jgi:hypothetical protein